MLKKKYSKSPKELSTTKLLTELESSLLYGKLNLGDIARLKILFDKAFTNGETYQIQRSTL